MPFDFGDTDTRSRLKFVRKAINDILMYGKSTTHGDRSVTRADLKDLMELESTLANMPDAAHENNQPKNRIGRSAIRYFEPD